MMVLMLGGKARVGKTTLAKWFSEYVYLHGYSPVMVSFADILKQEVTKVTGLTKDDDPAKFRVACQKLGAKMRKKDPDYWLKLFQERLKTIKEQDVINLEANMKGWHEKCVIVDDCRYLNEVGYGRKIGALQVFIAHGKRELIEHTGKWRQHESEDMANQIEEGKVGCEDIFHYRLTNDETEINFREYTASLFPQWLEYIKCEDPVLCPCPSCTAMRQGKEVDLGFIEKLIADMKIDKMLGKDYEDECDDDEHRQDA